MRGGRAEGAVRSCPGGESAIGELKESSKWELLVMNSKESCLEDWPELGNPVELQESLGRSPWAKDKT